MTPEETFKLRTSLRKYGVPTKSITLLKTIMVNPRITNTELGLALNMSKQAVSKHVNPLEAKGVIANRHGHPLWKAWEVVHPEVREILTEVLKLS